MGTKSNPGSFDCYKAAYPDEPMFVLLARDPLAPKLVRKWASLRMKQDGGQTDKTKEALQCANDMEEYQRQHPHRHK